MSVALAVYFRGLNQRVTLLIWPNHQKRASVHKKKHCSWIVFWALVGLIDLCTSSRKKKYGTLFSLPRLLSVCFAESKVDFDYYQLIEKRLILSWVLGSISTTLDKTKQVIDKLMVFTSNETKARGKAMS